MIVGDLIVRLFNECSKGETALLQSILTKECARKQQNVLAHSQGNYYACIVSYSLYFTVLYCML